jgi:hypothetical protein
MKLTIRWLLAAMMILIGIYALSSSIGAMGEQVALVGGHHVPYNIAIVVGLGGLGVGVLSILSALTGKKRWI